LGIVHLYKPNIELVYEKQILENKRIYSQSWSKVLHYILEIEKPFGQQMPTLEQLNQMGLTKLKDKDRQNIKDKFSVILSVFYHLVTTHVSSFLGCQQRNRRD